MPPPERPWSALRRAARSSDRTDSTIRTRDFRCVRRRPRSLHSPALLRRIERPALPLPGLQALGRALARAEVEVGGEEDGMVEIVDGLYAGDVIAIAPVMTLWMTELALLKSGRA